METTVLKLIYLPPYDWDSMLGFLSARAIPGVEAVSDRSYARTIRVGSVCGTLAVEPIAGDCVRLTVLFPEPEALPTIVSRVRKMFDLDADPHAIDTDLAQNDRMLARLIAARPGLRVPGTWDGYELAVRAVLGQQTTLPVAAVLTGRLVSACGEALPRSIASAYGLTHVFPTPARLENANVAALGITRSRAATLSSLAAAVRSDPTILPTELETIDETATAQRLRTVTSRLRSMSGIGEWTAQYIAMRAFGERDAFPATDIVLQRAIASAADLRATPAELLERAEKWRPWRAYAAMHLWAADSQPRVTSEPHMRAPAGAQKRNAPNAQQRAVAQRAHEHSRQAA